MPSNNRRAADRRRAWGRGPIILRLEPLEGRSELGTQAAAHEDLHGLGASHGSSWRGGGPRVGPACATL